MRQQKNFDQANLEKGPSGEENTATDECYPRPFPLNSLLRISSDPLETEKNKQ
jgi:hypothetical protein